MKKKNIFIAVFLVLLSLIIIGCQESSVVEPVISDSDSSSTKKQNDLLLTDFISISIPNMNSNNVIYYDCPNNNSYTIQYNFSGGFQIYNTGSAFTMIIDAFFDNNYMGRITANDISISQNNYVTFSGQNQVVTVMNGIHNLKLKVYVNYSNTNIEIEDEKVFNLWCFYPQSPYTAPISGGTHPKMQFQRYGDDQAGPILDIQVYKSYDNGVSWQYFQNLGYLPSSKYFLIYEDISESILNRGDGHNVKYWIRPRNINGLCTAPWTDMYRPIFYCYYNHTSQD